MKVILVGAYPPPFGGVQVHMIQLEKFLEGQGHTVFVINMGTNKALKSEKLVSPRYGFQVMHYLIKKRKHTCHLHFGGVMHTRLLLLAFFSSLLFLKRRCIISIHSGGLPHWGLPKNFIRRLFLRLSFSWCHGIICVNSSIADFFIKLGVRPERVYIVSPFAFERRQPDGLPTEPIRSFISGKGPILCNIGLLEPEYDLEFLIRVFGYFVNDHPHARLIMIGSGTLYKNIEKMISKLDLKEKVLMTGDLDHDDTLKVLASSDCFIRTSRYDGDCISLKEAIHLGIPAIASDTGLRPKEAILYPIDDEMALLRCLLETIGSAPKYKKVRIENGFSCLHSIEEILLAKEA